MSVDSSIRFGKVDVEKEKTENTTNAGDENLLRARVRFFGAIELIESGYASSHRGISPQRIVY
jgi:hypothetical protein